MESWIETLSDPLPANPLQVAADWLAQAWRDAAQPNPNAMVLATVDDRGQPSARVVLCKDIAPDAGFITFYTNYQSRKGRELEANPRVAAVFHWDNRHRQVRAEGRVERLPHAENDAYFRSRPRDSRIGAWASQQSAPLTSRAILVEAVATAQRRFAQATDDDIPRPPHWGGFRIAVDAMELWVEGEFRIHDSARWTRVTDRPADAGRHDPGDALRWSATRLQP